MLNNVSLPIHPTSKLNSAPFEFHLTGSRRFCGTQEPVAFRGHHYQSDWDFFIEAAPGLAEWLAENGWHRIEKQAMADDGEAYATGDVAEVWRTNHGKGYLQVDVIVVTNPAFFTAMFLFNTAFDHHPYLYRYWRELSNKNRTEVVWGYARAYHVMALQQSLKQAGKSVSAICGTQTEHPRDHARSWHTTDIRKKPVRATILSSHGVAITVRVIGYDITLDKYQIETIDFENTRSWVDDRDLSGWHFDE